MKDYGTLSQTGTSQDWQEGEATKQIEKQTAKLPSDFYLYAAFASMGVALAFKLLNKNDKSLFVGQWVAPMLLFGVYNKIVKTMGHDQKDQTGSGQKAF